MYMRLNTLVFISAFILVLTGCNNSNFSKPEVSQKILQNITNSIEEGEKIIDFNKVTNFKWDKMYIFTPYTSLETIEEELGDRLSHEETFGIAYSEGFDLIIFVKGNRIVHILEYPRPYELLLNDRINVYTSNEAKIKIQ
jgi:hypothetical protein